MKISLKKVLKPESFPISGKEPWLDATYKLLSLKNHPIKPELSATITISPLIEGRYAVQGDMAFKAPLWCNLCQAKLEYQGSKKLDITFQPPKKDPPSNEGDLALENLDEYFIEDGQIDLEQLLSEQVQLDIPDQIHCEKCGSPENDRLVYEGEPDEDSSPFAALKGLNLPS